MTRFAINKGKIIFKISKFKYELPSYMLKIRNNFPYFYVVIAQHYQPGAESHMANCPLFEKEDDFCMTFLVIGCLTLSLQAK